jgi:crossover junction endodeoxyribonuclease RusA
LLDVEKALKLPWPPSANRYWRHVGNRVLVSKEANKYKKEIKLWSLFWKRPCLKGRVAITMHAYPPDKRARDLDNLQKVLLDSLQDANIFVNDSQIDKITIERMPVAKNGHMLVWIEEI